MTPFLSLPPALPPAPPGRVLQTQRVPAFVDRVRILADHVLTRHVLGHRLQVYEAIRTEGTQKHLIPSMQTRADLYKFLDYHAYEQKLDTLFAQDKNRK